MPGGGSLSGTGLYAAAGGRLLLFSVGAEARDRLASTGHLDTIGVENVIAADEVIGRSTHAAFEAGEDLLKTVSEPAATPPP